MRTDVYRGYNGYVVQSGRYSVLFGGDTADTRAWEKVAGPRLDLAIVPIGAYNPWLRFHCTPEQAFRMANEARADRLLPVHHSTFRLSREPVHEPILRLQNAVGGDQDRIALRQVGEEWAFAKA
jgi:L-ascorbate metabolism protein UlaG (beta-lactamase superfamily)